MSTPSTTTSSSPIPSGWRLWFSTLEPFLGLSGFYLNHITPHYLLSTVAFPNTSPYSSSSSSSGLAGGPQLHLPIPPETQILLDTTTGLYAQNLFLQLVLTRARPDDLGLWKIWQGSLIVVDSVMWCAVVRNLYTLGVLGRPGLWKAEQWGNLVCMSGLLVARWWFVLRVGGKGTEKGLRKEKR